VRRAIALAVAAMVCGVGVRGRAEETSTSTSTSSAPAPHRPLSTPTLWPMGSIPAGASTGHVIIVRPPEGVEAPAPSVIASRPLRLKFDPDDRVALKRAWREQGGGVVLDVVGVLALAAGSAFFVPLAREEVRGDVSPAAWAGAGVATIAVGAALLGAGIHLYLRGHRREVAVIDRVFRRGALQF